MPITIIPSQRHHCAYTPLFVFAMFSLLARYAVMYIIITIATKVRIYGR